MKNNNKIQWKNDRFFYYILFFESFSIVDVKCNFLIGNLWNKNGFLIIMLWKYLFTPNGLDFSQQKYENSKNLPLKEPQKTEKDSKIDRKE